MKDYPEHVDVSKIYNRDLDAQGMVIMWRGNDWDKRTAWIEVYEDDLITLEDWE